jgi:hypothetical protein
VQNEPAHDEPTYWEEQRAEFCTQVQQLTPDDALMVLRTLGDECTAERALIPMLIGLVKGAVQRRQDAQRWTGEGGESAASDSLG